MRRLHNTDRLSERASLRLTAFAQWANIDRSIRYRIGRPLRGSTAWKIARADAATARIRPKAADVQIIVVIS